MASALERRMDLARASLAARAGQASQQQQTAMQERFASTGGLQSGAAIKAGQAAERALSRQQLAGESDISRGEAQAEAERERAAMQRKFAQEQAAESRQFASSEAAAGRKLAASEGALNRALAQKGIDIASKELTLNEQISLDNLARKKAEEGKEDTSPMGAIKRMSWEKAKKQLQEMKTKKGAAQQGRDIQQFSAPVDEKGKREKNIQQRGQAEIFSWFTGKKDGHLDIGGRRIF